MPAAAEAPVRKLAGSGQNIAGTAETPICAKQSSAMTMTGLEISPDRPIPIAAMSSGDMAFSLHCAVGVLAEQHHADAAEYEGQGGQQSGLGIAHAKGRDDGGQEEGNSVACRVQAEIHQGAEQNADIRKCLEQRQMFDPFLVSSLVFLHAL